jgi:hypothetical protein
MDIHELGLILLQLGCGKRLEDFWGWRGQGRCT